MTENRTINLVVDKIDEEFVVQTTFKEFKAPWGINDLEQTRFLLDSWLTNRSGYGTVIAYDGKTPVGFCLHAPVLFREKIFFLSCGCTYKLGSREISVVSVEKERHGEGIGRLLVEKAIEQSEQFSPPQMYATCWRGKEGESYWLFKKLGFTEFGVLEGHYADKSNGIVVCKELERGTQRERRHILYM